jgi:hypothetical protein
MFQNGKSITNVVILLFEVNGFKNTKANIIPTI